MAESNTSAGDLEPEQTAGYKAPAKKTLSELQNLDTDDPSLDGYKKSLIKSDGTKPFPDDPRNVIVDKLLISVEGRPDAEINLRGNLVDLKKSPIVVKEGCKYRVKIRYYVQSEIVSGLKYIMATYRKPINVRVAKEDIMLGSYGPQRDAYEWKSTEEEAPKGVMSRGLYHVKSRFTDDDQQDILTWEWALEIKKDWHD